GSGGRFEILRGLVVIEDQERIKGPILSHTPRVLTSKLLDRILKEGVIGPRKTGAHFTGKELLDRTTPRQGPEVGVFELIEIRSLPDRLRQTLVVEPIEEKREPEVRCRRNSVGIGIFLRHLSGNLRDGRPTQTRRADQIFVTAFTAAV